MRILAELMSHLRRQKDFNELLIITSKKRNQKKSVISLFLLLKNFSLTKGSKERRFFKRAPSRSSCVCTKDWSQLTINSMHGYTSRGRCYCFAFIEFFIILRLFPVFLDGIFNYALFCFRISREAKQSSELTTSLNSMSFEIKCAPSIKRS